jgi:peptide/nickel transport system substrate-binding protein
VDNTLERGPARARGTRGRVAGIAVVVLLVVGVAVSCGNSGEDGRTLPVFGGGPDTAVTGVRAPSEAAGGTLRVVTGEVDNLDPQRSYLPGVWNLMRLYTRTLVTYSSEPGRTGELVPDLATDLGTTPDGGTTWTFTLREGVRFETGEPITSRDVKYGIERSFASDVVVGGPTRVVELLDDPENPYAGPYQDETPGRLGLASVDTPDDRTITFRLRSPQPDLPYVMALPSSSPVPAASDTGADYGRDPVSSGPYLVATRDDVTGIVLERNPQWDPATDEVRTALPDRVVVRTGLTGVERDQALLAGSADVDISGTGIQTPTTARLGEDTGSDVLLVDRIDEVTNNVVRLLALPTDVAPFDDLACRAAVAAAVDRAAVQEVLGGPTEAVRTSQLWPRGVEGGPDEPDPAPDPAAAEQALATCGQPQGFDTVLAVPDAPTGVAVAQEVAGQLERIGIRAEVRPLDAPSFYATEIGNPDRVRSNGIGIVLATWTADFPTPGSFLVPLVDGRSVSTVGNTNFARLADPAIDGFIDTARAAAGDPEAARAAWREVAAAATATGAYVPLTESRVQLLAGQRLRNGVVVGPYTSYDLATAGVR